MTFNTPSQLARAAAPTGSLMKTPDYLEALVHKPARKTTLRQKTEQAEREKQALKVIEKKRMQIMRQAAERKRREKLDSYREMTKRDRTYLDRIRKRAASSKQERPMPGDFDMLMRIGSEVTKFSLGEILGNNRMSNLVYVRHAMIRITRLLWPGLSTPEIGRKFNRDHTSVLWALGGCRKGAKPRIDREEKIEAIVDDVMARLMMEQES